MELKLIKIQEAIPLGLLLIVPYGIETAKYPDNIKYFSNF